MNFWAVFTASVSEVLALFRWSQVSSRDWTSIKAAGYCNNIDIITVLYLQHSILRNFTTPRRRTIVCRNVLDTIRYDIFTWSNKCPRRITCKMLRMDSKIIEKILLTENVWSVRTYYLNVYETVGSTYIRDKTQKYHTKVQFIKYNYYTIKRDGPWNCKRKQYVPFWTDLARCRILCSIGESLQPDINNLLQKRYIAL